MTPATPRTPGLGEAFPEALRRATGIAALSPSSHNCQPWALARLESHPARRAAADLLGCPDDGSTVYLALAADRRRSLTALPAHVLEMRLSCAAYWRLLCRALAAQGWAVVRERAHDGGAGACGPAADPRLPGGPWPRDWSLLWTAALRRTGEAAESLAALDATAHARHTNRGPYEDEPLAPGLLGDLARPQVTVGRAITVRHLTEDHEREAFAEFLGRYGGIDFSHPAAWRETHSYIRWSPAAVRAHGDGFPATQLFGPMSGRQLLAKRIALAPPVMKVLCRFGYDRSLAGGLAAEVRRTPAVVLMNFADETPGVADAFRGGARIADYWLGAASAGLALHPLSVVMQHDRLRTMLQDRLGLSGRLFFVSRVGRPRTAFPPAPRSLGAADHRTV
ncbi:RedV protein [Streptomyces sp. NPDC008001]|uniref:RedV protein n=1 Tax=Streptomyces sp. NPDC008001 TaxID=3364804 RepID=UPI0036F15427